MALYQPTNVFPSSFAGVGGGAVDVTQGFTVSWQVNGSSAMTAYQIQIFENTSASNKVYDSGQTNVTPAFFGTSSTGQVNFFEVPIAASALSGMSNGFASGYKMLITQWWGTNSVQQLSPSFFWTRTDPTISISAFTNPVTENTATFTGVYTQAQGDSLDWFRWMLAVQGQESTPIEDTGYIYGTEDIQVTYDGLFTGTAYAVRCMIQTEYGIQADTGWVNFTVSYPVSEMSGYVEACLSQIEGIAIQWPRVSYIPGKADGSYTIEGGLLDLPFGSSITWDEKNGAPMLFESEWSIAWSAFYPESGTSPAVSINGALNFSILPTQIELTYNGAVLASLPLTGILEDYPVRVVLTPRELHVYYAQLLGGLYPSETLYPSEDLYPSDGDFNWIKYTYPLTWVQPDITSITLYGKQKCEWITVINGEVSGSLLVSLLTDLTYEPEWTLDTLFLATFGAAGINGGNITPDEDVVGVAIYRKSSTASKLDFVVNAPIGTTMILDEGFLNQEQYTYYVFVLGENTYVSPALISNVVQPMFWNWTILACTMDSDGIYHLDAAHVFRNNVTTDALSNNNTPSILQNFTPYPTRQPTSYNYLSSTLVGYIGKVDYINNKYVDTTAQADALWELSVSQSPKFLRNRKGNLWRIESAASITMQTGDNQAPQPYLGSFPWMETGPAEGASIVCMEGDGAWDSIITPPAPTDIPRIVVTAEMNATVTITNGVQTLNAISTGVVVYSPASQGEWTITAQNGSGGFAEKTIQITTNETYYVGMILSAYRGTITVNAPQGTIVTINNGTYMMTQEVM